MRARRCAATEPKYLLARASTQPRGSENPSACQSQRTVFIMRCRDLISSSDFERTDTLSFAKKAAQAPVSIKSIAGKVCAHRGIVLDTQLTASTSSQKMWTLEEGYLSRDLSRISPIHTPEWLKLFWALKVYCFE